MSQSSQIEMSAWSEIAKEDDMLQVFKVRDALRRHNPSNGGRMEGLACRALEKF